MPAMWCVSLPSVMMIAQCCSRSDPSHAIKHRIGNWLEGRIMLIMRPNSASFYILPHCYISLSFMQNNGKLYHCYISLLSIIGKYHCYIPLLYTIAIYHYYIPMLNTIAMYHCYIPLLYTIVIYHCYIPLLYTIHNATLLHSITINHC